MKALKISNAPLSFGMFLMSMDRYFTFEVGNFYIHTGLNADKFYNWCLRNGVRQTELDAMTMEEVELD